MPSLVHIETREKHTDHPHLTLERTSHIAPPHLFGVIVRSSRGKRDQQTLENVVGDAAGGIARETGDVACAAATLSLRTAMGSGVTSTGLRGTATGGGVLLGLRRERLHDVFGICGRCMGRVGVVGMRQGCRRSRRYRRDGVGARVGKRGHG